MININHSVLLLNLFVCILFILLKINDTQAQNGMVQISGHTTLPAGEEVRIIAVSDYISNQIRTLATDKISKKGNFSLSFKLKEIQQVQLICRTSRAEFFVVPNYTYDFEVEMDTNLFTLFDPQSYGGFLQIRNLKNIDSNDLNVKINLFEANYAHILDSFRRDIFKMKSKSALDTIISLIQNKFHYNYEPNNFYYSYIYYSIGELERIVFGKNAQYLYRKYLDNDYILYNNPAYMRFFKDFYGRYLYLSPRISSEILTKNINENPNYLTLFNDVGKDFYLVNERIRELVILMNLYQFYGDKEHFVKENLLTLIQYIVENTHFPEHKKIGENILEELRFQQKNLLNEIKFIDTKGHIFQLKNYNGKWVYLHFFNLQCPDCIREMLILKDLQQKYKDSLEIISISVDFNLARLSDFLKENTWIDWNVWNINQRYDILLALEVTALPDYILLNKQGKISMRNAPRPDQSLSLFLMQKFYHEKENKNPLFQQRE